MTKSLGQLVGVVGVSAALFVQAGCLPAYNNGPLAVADLAGVDLTGADFTMGCTGAQSVAGKAFNIDDLVVGAGQTVYPADWPPTTVTKYLSSAVTTNGFGAYTLPIPCPLVNQPGYLVIDGMFNSSPIVRTHFLPQLTLDGGPAEQSLAVHYFKNAATDATSLINIVAADLVANGNLPAGTTATTFLSGYNFSHAELTKGSATYTTYTVQLLIGGTPLDNTVNCKPITQCCWFYQEKKAGGYHVNFAATSSPGYVIVVCPATETRDVTLRQTAPLNMIVAPPTTSHPATPFPDITIPAFPGDATYIDWTPQ